MAIFDSFNQGFTAGRELRAQRERKNALLDAGDAFAKRDYGGAANALFATDPNAAIQMQARGDAMATQQQDQQRQSAERLLKAGAQVAGSIRSLPVEQRLPAYQQAWRQLAPSIGLDEQTLSILIESATPDQLSDDMLDATVRLSMDPEGYARLQELQMEAQKPIVLGEGGMLLDRSGKVLRENPKNFAPQTVVYAGGGGGGGGGGGALEAGSGPTPMPEYGPNAFKLANGSIVEIYRDKQGQPRVGKTLLVGPGGGNPDVVKTTLTQRAGRQSLLLQEIGRAKELAKKGAVGLGSVLSGVPETKSYDLARTLDTIKANIGFAELQSMRDSSPTGGALGQVTERELALLQAVVGSLDQAQSRDQFTANLDRLEQQYKSSMAAIAAAYERDYGQPLPIAGGLPNPQMPGGGAAPQTDLKAKYGLE